ncbi:glycoside hydrolase family 88 protein [Microbacterium ulmi]|uniref:Glucuronyl hydrolase n=1 Tax=Microbacterium ulmi TaxID=179095 RepID=A0A7Y2PZT4_9MICO|nr:glycoside hydrolase family 88 protein [Microbacterium ulmi]NII68699.1 unsaturated chondroitin disaccharide hydrolase [Microbacterium ulmi]NNH03638.1 glucuronyl hydrolase [Microbacterium ulmi]
MTSTHPAHTRETSTETAITAALSTVRRNIATFGESYPGDTTTGSRYLLRPAVDGFALGANRGWTTSFWVGLQWLAFELTGEDECRDAATAHAADFARRVRAGEDLDTHDLGFLYTLGSVVPWRLLADDESRRAALLAADHLMTRFLEPAGVIQAWGDLSDPHQRGRTIIDSLMNMPLLTWAFEQTGDERFADAVLRHTAQLREHILREDDSTFHTFYWDAETGAPLRGATEQGAHDDSCWARGQAWGVYGFALNHRATGDPALLEASRRCADYFLAHLPADGVPYWDLVYGDESDAPRDSSAAAIAVCGLLELASLEPDPIRAARADAAARRILDSLIAGYTPDRREDSDALLLHGVYDLPKDNGVDEGTLWGDYFYLEALVRVTRPDWRPYWWPEGGSAA